MRKSPVIRTTVAAAAVALLGPLAPAAAPSAFAATSDALTVVSFNIGGQTYWRPPGTTHNPCKIVRQIDAKNPAIILVQEATKNGLYFTYVDGKKVFTAEGSIYSELTYIFDQGGCGISRPYKLAEGKLEHSAVPGSPPKMEGSHIYYDPTKVTFVEGEERPFGMLLGKGEPEYYTIFKPGTRNTYYSLAKFTVKASGRTVVAASIHPTARHTVIDGTLWKRSYWEAYALGILERRAVTLAGTSPLIIGGDFNQQKTGISDRSDKLYDPVHPKMKELGMVDARPASHKTATTLSPGVIYDFIYYRKDTSAGSSATASGFATTVSSLSDHYMISTKVTFTR